MNVTPVSSVYLSGNIYPQLPHKEPNPHICAPKPKAHQKPQTESPYFENTSETVGINLNAKA